MFCRVPLRLVAAGVVIVLFYHTPKEKEASTLPVRDALTFARMEDRDRAVVSQLTSKLGVDMTNAAQVRRHWRVLRVADRVVTVFFKYRHFKAAIISRPYVATERASANVDLREMLIPKPNNSNDNTAEPRVKASDFDEADEEQHLVLVSEIHSPPTHLQTTTHPPALAPLS